jgi:hypothetical protein
LLQLILKARPKHHTDQQIDDDIHVPAVIGPELKARWLPPGE